MPLGAPDRLFGALVLLVMAAFVAAGSAPTARWRARLRLISLLGFAAAVAIALAEAAMWLG